MIHRLKYIIPNFGVLQRSLQKCDTFSFHFLFFFFFNIKSKCKRFAAAAATIERDRKLRKREKKPTIMNNNRNKYQIIYLKACIGLFIWLLFHSLLCYCCVSVSMRARLHVFVIIFYVCFMFTHDITCMLEIVCIIVVIVIFFCIFRRQRCKCTPYKEKHVHIPYYFVIIHLIII